jgi:signal transduction histidine kinase
MDAFARTPIDSAGYLAHGQSFLWTSALLRTYVAADGSLALAWLSIALALLWFLRRRQDIRPGWLLSSLALSVAFSIASGAVYAMSLWTLWHPDYAVDAAIRAVAASAAVATAVALWRLMPEALQAPGSRQLQATLATLEGELAQRRQAEAALIETNRRLEQQLAQQAAELDAARLRLQSETQAVSRLNEELERRVAQRTAQLEAVNRELETFTYSVSHDLKAPLRGIDGFSRLLLEDYASRLDEEGRNFLLYIRQGTRQMSQLIQDLLDYSRLERRPLKNESINLRVVSQSIVSQMQTEIEKRDAAVRVTVPDEELVVDENGLRVALRNLLDNALKFSRQQPKAEIEIGGMRGQAGFVVWVRDNGIGIEAKFHDRIFQIFQRLHRAEDYPGTGIGLAIVRKAMQRIGGSVRVESVPDQGSTFFLEIPQ